MQSSQILHTLAASIPLGMLVHGLVTGQIITHGYTNWRPNRTRRDEEPVKFWGDVVFYGVAMVVIAALGWLGG